MSIPRAISRPCHRSGARARWLLSTLAVAVLLSCRGEEGLPPEDAAEREAAPVEAAVDWPCEAKGYPCTWEEMSAEATERGFAVADQALDRFEPGGARELVDWLEAQPGVVEAGEEDPTVVWFRVKGGRQIFVQGPLPPTGIERVEGRAGTASSELHPDVHLASTGGLLIEGFDALSSMLSSSWSSEPRLLAGVTGRDRNVDRRVNQRDQRKAIILEPMNWEFCYELTEGQYDRLIGEPGVDKRKVDRLKRENSRTIERICDGKAGTSALKGLGTAATPYLSEGAAVRDVLEEMPAYAGHVALLRDEQVDLSVLGRLKEYDVVHFNTHGSRRSVTLGTSVDWSGRGRVRGAPARRRGLSATVFKAGKHGPRRRSWSADQNFFRSLHPRGLDRTLIFLSSCSGLGHPDKKTPPLADALLGKESMLVGWGVTIGVLKARQTAVSFYLHLAEGWSGKEAIRRIPDTYGSPVFADEPARREDITPAQADNIRRIYPRGGVDDYMAEYGPEGELKRGAVFGSRGGDMRIREVTRLLHPPSPLSASGQRRPLVDGDELDDLVVGQVEDGVDDLLRVSVEMDAILSEERMLTFVHLELDGKRIGSPKDLMTAREVREGTWQVDFDRVPVGKDLRTEVDYELEAVVRLPEKGESRYAAILSSRSCYWQLDLEGTPRAGHYSGRMAAFIPGGDQLVISLSGTDPYMMINIGVRGEISATGERHFRMGGIYSPAARSRGWVDPPDDGNVNITFQAEPLMSHMVYTTGDGTPIYDDEPGSDQVIGHYPPFSDLFLRGDPSSVVRGHMTGTMAVSPDIASPPVENARVELRFRAQGMMGPGGLPRFDVCGGGS